jgi:hypothetical protein
MCNVIPIATTKSCKNDTKLYILKHYRQIKEPTGKKEKESREIKNRECKERS